MMKQRESNRVLVRYGARVLNVQEVERVIAGSAHTETKCSMASPKATTFDGDFGECVVTD